MDATGYFCLAIVAIVAIVFGRPISYSRDRRRIDVRIGSCGDKQDNFDSEKV